MSIELLSLEHIKSLQPGDEFESEGLFQGLEKEVVKWKLNRIDYSELASGNYEFMVTYFGIALSKVYARIVDGAVHMEVAA